jgi:histone acetyltransferase (RNA polymerase elongator complex component)
MIIPFFITHAGCPHQCVFCNQKSITGKNKPPEASSLHPSISRYLEAHRDKKAVQVAFYGGSFTALPIEDQISYLESVQPFIRSGDIESIRLSTRPDTITPDILAVLKQYGVTTIELGAQSMDDKVLLLSGRGHSAADTVIAVALLREYHFFVGLQLMPGLPGDTPETFPETVSQVIALRPDFVRIYPALVIKDTPLAERYRAGEYSPLSLDDAVLLCHKAMARFEQAGIEVIRVGLQPTAELERPGTILAGPWHPAFRQLVESSRFLEKMCSLLSTSDQAGTVTLVVNPADISTVIGQKRQNINAIKVRYGRDVKVLADARVPAGSVNRCIPAQDTL